MRRRREQDGVIIGHQPGNKRCHIFSQLVRENGIIGDQNFGHTRDFGGGLCCCIAAIARDENMHIAQLPPSCHDSQTRILQRRIIMFGIDENAHAATPISLSLATSASVSATLIPAERTGGSVTFSVFRRGLTSTP